MRADYAPTIGSTRDVLELIIVTTTRRLAAALLTMGLLGALLAPAALAQQTETDDTNVTVNAGTLNMDTLAVGDFAPVEVGSSAQTTAATLENFNVRDFRGTGDGWHVTAHATQFAEHDGADYVTDGDTLAAESLSLAQPTVTAVGDTTSPSPSVSAGPYVIDGAAAVQFASAAADEGMGEYELAFDADSLTLDLPVDVVATTYRSDVTIDLVSGP